MGSSQRMRLAWFVNYLVPGWNIPWSGNAGAEWMNGDFYVDMARRLDAAGFDAMMLEDGNYLSDAYGGTFEAELKHTVRGPKNDPLPLLPVLAAATERLGFIATMSSSFYQPFLLARLVTTLDHLTGGRVGWNVVTSSSPLAAQQFGMDALPDHDERYLIAEEFVDVVKKLWRSWDRDAVVMDRATGTYVDHEKVRPIHHHGTYFDVRGPLNALPPLQDLPPIFQAGGSPTGREFAARSADVIVSSAKGIDDMREYRAEVRRRAELNGRNPDDIKILFMISPFLEESDELARRRREERLAITDERAERRLLMMSDEIDFSQFPLDQPFPTDLSTNGSQSLLKQFAQWAGDRPLREAAAGDEFEAFPAFGTPETVADEMEHAFREVGGDGYLIFAGGGGMLTRRYVDQVCEGLVPELRRRGLVWDAPPAGLGLNERLAYDQPAPDQRAAASA
ncbi:NtaA/DmoA family FMN-dependent monooxygenase [Nocardioides bruguierae]|uniref:NtaA/DmoA family FMN-dependent monooxygenase n=1 Tax=Nocardioides bruguierae TaxID=2945102 RepID=UPI002021338F|nr:NtaA/DmoA family FMN-dependent monooxygenase [Nocardioides bruguierae]MCL8026227.1 NtaA/DmoA family FMN-dependent monooxygenase [Nocardioides bruguierae]